MGWKAVALAVVVGVSGAFASAAWAGPVGGAADVIDAQVVAAMKRGVEQLLTQRKGDNWEGTVFTDRRFAGGETGLVLTALLEVWQSLPDDAAILGKLDPRGAELGPTLQWLAKVQPVGTYAAGFKARAMALVPPGKSKEGEEWLGGSMESCKWYLLATMGADGGYTYDTDIARFDAAYEAYMKAALTDDRTAKTEKSNFENTVLGEFTRRFGGPETRLRWKAAELQEKLKGTKDGREVARIKAELKVLDVYTRELLASAPWKKDQEMRLAAAKRMYDDAVKQGGKDAAQRIAAAKETVAQLERRFTPMGDASNAHNAELGAAALHARGLAFPAKYWEATERFWRGTQKADGSWVYYAPGAPNGEGTSTVGAEGLASLLMARSFCETEAPLMSKPDKNIDAGMAWLAKSFAEPGDLRDPYALCAVERVAEFTGARNLGTVQWYAQGASDVVSRQRRDGSFSGKQMGNVATASALIFLARGRNPVLFNKLQYKGAWNARPWDAMMATHWLEERVSRRLNWQVVSFEMPSEAWQEAPVLLITGSQDPKFTKDEIEKLRGFIKSGGMIFSSADGGNAGFTAAMKRYASQVMEGKFEMRPLAKNDELFSKEMGGDFTVVPALLGMSDGSREVWIHSTADVGADWQLQRFKQKASFELAVAIYNYAGGKGKLRPRLQASEAR